MVSTIHRDELRLHPRHELVPRGEAALTRALLARGALRVVSERRGRVVQVGVAAPRDVIEAARAEVAATAERRAASRERSRARRAREDAAHAAAFDAAVRRLFPSIPDADRRAVVERACEVGGGRVGRCAAARELEDDPVRLAVRAHVRHAHTPYDDLLRRAGAGRPFGRASRDARRAAREAVRAIIDDTCGAWARPRATPAPAAPREVVPAPPIAPRPPAPAPAAPAPAGALWARGLSRR